MPITRFQIQSGLGAAQVGLGFPAAAAAAGGGYVSPSTVNASLDCLAKGASCGSFVPPARWPAIGGAMTRSIDWDAANGYAFESAVAPHLASMP